MIFKKFKYKNWRSNEPTNLLEYLQTPSSKGLRIINFIFQKIFRINAEVPFMVHYTSTVRKTVILGKNVAPFFANAGNCYFSGINKIFIDDNTIFAPGVKVISSNHDINDFSKHIKNIDPIRIGKNCWLGANCTILPGIQLGDNVIVGAGSVVTKSFEGNVIIGGIPAKIIKNNPSQE